jgi:PAS domain S-box-containing protein
MGKSKSGLSRSELMLRRAERLAKVGCWELELSTGRMLGSDEAIKIYGLESREDLFEKISRVPLPEYRSALDEALRDLVAGSAPYDIAYKIKRPSDGEIADIHSVAEYDAETDTVFGVIQDVTRQKAAEREFVESEARYSSLFRNSGSAMLIIDPDSGNIVDANDAASSFYGLSLETLKAMKIEEINTLPADKIKQEMRLAVEHHRNYFNFRHRLADGRVRDVEVHSGPITFEGRTQLYSIVHDVTEAKKAEEHNAILLREESRLLAEKELLLKEVHHRIKNNMQMIEALLSLQEQSLEDEAAKTALMDARSRVLGMMEIYDKLYRSADFSTVDARDYFEGLMAGINSTYGAGRPIRLDFAIEELMLNTQTLVPLAIIVNELAVNAFKYAFPDGRPGTITLGLARLDNGRVELRLRDDGIGSSSCPEGATRGGFGLILVESLAAQIGAELERRDDSGTEYRIVFKGA